MNDFKRFGKVIEMMNSMIKILTSQTEKGKQLRYFHVLDICSRIIIGNQPVLVAMRHFRGNYTIEKEWNGSILLFAGATSRAHKETGWI